MDCTLGIKKRYFFQQNCEWQLFCIGKYLCFSIDHEENAQDQDILGVSKMKLLSMFILSKILGKKK
jgi:hypothetical protein